MPGTPNGFKDWLEQALGQGGAPSVLTLGGEAQWRDGPFQAPARDPTWPGPGPSPAVQARAAGRWMSIQNPDPKQAQPRRIGTTTAQFQNAIAPFWVGQ